MPGRMRTLIRLACYAFGGLCAAIAGLSAFIGFMAAMFGRGLSMELSLLDYLGYLTLPVLSAAVAYSLFRYGDRLKHARSGPENSSSS